LAKNKGGQAAHGTLGVPKTNFKTRSYDRLGNLSIP